MDIVFYILLALFAFLYASVGHGGASGYLALMSFYSFVPEVMRPTALLLNIFVSAIAFILYYRSGYFRWNLFWPFAVASIPAAFIGGMTDIDEDLYKKILAVVLVFSVVRLLSFTSPKVIKVAQKNLLASILIGALIGFLSGMIGIGGGIILSPLILLFKWADMKETAAVSALFIFVNSLSGLAGMYSFGMFYNPSMFLMMLVALVGGLSGAYFGANRFNLVSLRYILSVVLMIAAGKLFLT